MTPKLCKCTTLILLVEFSRTPPTLLCVHQTVFPDETLPACVSIMNRSSGRASSHSKQTAALSVVLYKQFISKAGFSCQDLSRLHQLKWCLGFICRGFSLSLSLFFLVLVKLSNYSVQFGHDKTLNYHILFPLRQRGR